MYGKSASWIRFEKRIDRIRAESKQSLRRESQLIIKMENNIQLLEKIAKKVGVSVEA